MVFLDPDNVNFINKIDCWEPHAANKTWNAVKVHVGYLVQVGVHYKQLRRY